MNQALETFLSKLDGRDVNGNWDGGQALPLPLPNLGASETQHPFADWHNRTAVLTVQVEEEDGNFFISAACSGDRLSESILQKAAIGRARQGVVVREILNLLLDVLTLGDVLGDATLARRDRHRDLGAVLPQLKSIRCCHRLAGSRLQVQTEFRYEGFLQIHHSNASSFPETRSAPVQLTKAPGMPGQDRTNR